MCVLAFCCCWCSKCFSPFDLKLRWWERTGVNLLHRPMPVGVCAFEVSALHERWRRSYTLHQGNLVEPSCCSSSSLLCVCCYPTLLIITDAGGIQSNQLRDSCLPRIHLHCPWLQSSKCWIHQHLKENQIIGCAVIYCRFHGFA
jgi:hypothetical protein